MSLRAVEEPVPTATAAPPPQAPPQARPRLERVLAAGQQRQQPRATGTVCSEGAPRPLLPPAPQDVHELMKSIEARIAPHVYNDVLYAQLYHDYDALLKAGYLGDNYIRNTIVDASQTLGNITASYELRLTTTDTWNVTVHVQESSALCGSRIRSASETIFRNNGRYTDILRFWQMHNLGPGTEQIARELGMPEDSTDTELRGALVNRYKDVLLYLANNMAPNGSDVSMDLIRRAIDGDNVRDAGAFHQLYQRVQSSQQKPVQRDFATALWFSDRIRKEAVSGNNLKGLTWGQIHNFNHAPFNENIIPRAFMYLDIVKAIAEAFAFCLLQMSHAPGGAAREIARQQYHREFGDASAFGGF